MYPLYENGNVFVLWYYFFKLFSCAANIIISISAAKMTRKLCLCDVAEESVEAIISPGLSEWF